MSVQSRYVDERGDPGVRLGPDRHRDPAVSPPRTRIPRSRTMSSSPPPVACCHSPASTTGGGSSPGSRGAGCSRRCFWCSSRSGAPTCCSRLTRSRPYSASPGTPTSCSSPKPPPCWDSARCSCSSPGCSTDPCYLSTGLSLILSFIGVKLILHFLHLHVPSVPEISTGVSLAVIVIVLATATLASLHKARTEPTLRAHAGSLREPRRAREPHRDAMPGLQSGRGFASICRLTAHRPRCGATPDQKEKSDEPAPLPHKAGGQRPARS